MWTLDHLDDLAVDFLVFYRIDDIWELGGAEFMKLAMRTFAFKGVMRAYAEKEAYDAEQKKRKPSSPGSRGTTPSASDKVSKPVAALMVDPETSNLFEIG